MASKKSANTININVISNNINMNKSQDHLHPISNQHQTYKIQPFCLKLNNSNSSDSASSLSSLSRLLHNLQPSQQQQVLTQQFTDKINRLDPSISTYTSQITKTLLSQLNRKQLLQLLYDDIALKHKINEIHTIFKPQSPSATPPPSSIKISQPSPLTLQRCSPPLHPPLHPPNVGSTQWRVRCMELQSKYDSSQHEIMRLRYQLKVSKWKWFDIYKWILSLNDHFAQYDQQLFDNLKIHNVDGDCIKILNKHDWIQLGITNVNTVKLLMKQISKVFVASSPDMLLFDDTKENSLENEPDKIKNETIHVIENKTETKQEQKSVTDTTEQQSAAVHAHPHSKLPATEVAQIKLIDRCSAFIVALPTTMCNETSLTQQFGRFGNILNNGIVIGNSPPSIAANSRYVRIHFETEQSVIQLIDYVNNFMLLDGVRVCKATFGYTFYCSYWITFGKCMDTQCLKKHGWCKQTDIMTDEMITRFRKMPCGNDSRMNKSNIGVTSRELTQMQSLQTMQSVASIVHSQPINRNIVITQQQISQQVQINSLQQSLQMIRAKAIDEVATLQKQLMAKTNAYDTVANAYNELQLEAEALQMKCCVLDHKCIELEKKLNGDVEVKNAEEEEVKNVEEITKKNDYSQWNIDDLYGWICGLNNGHFMKYKMVYDNLKVEEIDGKCLKKLDKDDIHRFGITSFKDKLLLMQYIQKLMNDNANI